MPSQQVPCYLSSVGIGILAACRVWEYGIWMLAACQVWEYGIGCWLPVKCRNVALDVGFPC